MPSMTVALVAVLILAPAAAAQGTPGDYLFTSAVNVAKGGTAPGNPTVPQTMSPPAVTFMPNGLSTPLLGVQVNSITTAAAEGTASGGSLLALGTLNLVLPAPPASGTLTYAVTLSYNFILTIDDLSFGSPGTTTNSAPIKGTISGTVLLTSTGEVTVQLSHIFTGGVPGSNAINVTCIGSLGTTSYTLNFAPCGLKTTSTPFPYFQIPNIGVFGALVTEVQF